MPNVESQAFSHSKRRLRWAGSSALLPILLSITPAAASAQTRFDTAKTIHMSVDELNYISPSQINHVTRMFEAAYPNIKLTVKIFGPDSWIPAERAAIAAKSGPSVVMMYGGPDIFSFIDGLQPLTSYITSRFRSLFPGGFADESTGLSPSGTVYGVPYTLDGFVFYINKVLFAKAGIPPTAPTTWQQLLSDCAALKAKGITPITAGFKDGYYLQWILDSWLPELMTAKQQSEFISHPNWTTNPAVKAVLQDEVTLYKRGYFTANSVGIPMFPTANGSFWSGKAAMFFGLPSNGNPATENVKAAFMKNIVMAGFPKLPGDHYTHPVISLKPEFGLAITKFAPDKTAAWDYIKFLFRPAVETYVWNASFSGIVPNTNNDPNLAATWKYPIGKALLSDARPGHYEQAVVSEASETPVFTAMWNDASEVIDGSMSIRSYLDALQSAQAPIPPA